MAKQFKLYSPMQIQKVKNPSYTNTSGLWNSRTKARIEPLFELNRTAASVASSNNGMPTLSTPFTQKKNSCRMLEGEKNNMQAPTRRKNFIVNKGVEKKIHD